MTKKPAPPARPRARAVCYVCAHHGDEHSGREPFVCMADGCGCNAWQACPTESEREAAGQLNALEEL